MHRGGNHSFVKDLQYDPAKHLGSVWCDWENMTRGESVQPLESVNWYINRAHGQERPGLLLDQMALVWLGGSLGKGMVGSDGAWSSMVMV